MATWMDAPGVVRLALHYGSVGVDDDAPILSPRDHLAAARWLGEAWQLWDLQHPELRDFSRFFVLAPIVEDELARELGDTLAANFLAHAERYPSALDKLADRSPELLERFNLAVQRVLGPPDEDGRADTNTHRLLKDLDESLDAPSSRGRARWRYRHVIAPRIVRIVIRTGTGPQALAEILRRPRAPLEQLAPFADRIEGDRLLASLHSCRRLVEPDRSRARGA